MLIAFIVTNSVKQNRTLNRICYFNLIREPSSDFCSPFIKGRQAVLTDQKFQLYSQSTVSV